MRKRTLVLIMLLAGGLALRAQDQVGCTQLLADAREAYGAGMVELVPDLLLPCLESGLSGDAKQEAYKLVINAYLFDYLPEMADSMMGEFLREFPDYEEDPSDPAEFVQLLESRRERMPPAGEEEVVREEDREDTGEEEEPVRERTRREKPEIPAFPGEAVISAGFVLGGHGTFPQLIEPYSVTDPLSDGGSYALGVPGFRVGGSFALPLAPGVEASASPVFLRSRFNYRSSPFDFTSYEYREYQAAVRLPLSLAFILNPRSRTNLYLRAGAAPEYLFSAAASATRTYDLPGDAATPDVELEKTDLGSMRTSFNLYALAGLGIRVQLRDAFLFFEARYNYGIIQANREEGRYDNQDLTWLIYHVDSDFRLHQAGLTAGMAWKLY